MTDIVPKEEMQNYVGKELGTSDWFTVDQDMINKFADVTHDHQFIHVDEEAAAKTPFGSTIAHGFLSLSMITHLTMGMGVAPEGVVMGINYGFNKVRFLQPVNVNSEIRGKSVLTAVDERRPGQFLVTTTVTVEIKGQDKPALICEWLTLLMTG